MFKHQFYCGDRFGWRDGTERFPTSNAAYFEQLATEKAQRTMGMTVVAMRTVRA